MISFLMLLECYWITFKDLYEILAFKTAFLASSVDVAATANKG